MSSNRVSTLQMGGGPADHYASCYNLIFRDPAVQHLWGVGASPAMPGRALRAPHQAPSGLDLSASIADAFAAVPLRAALANAGGVVCGLRLACCSLHPCTPFSRSRSARAAHAGVLSAVFEPVTAALDSFAAASSAASSLLVRDVAGEYRPADADEVLQAAQRVLAGRVRGTDVLTSPAVVKDFLRVRLGNLPHEIFAVVHLDAQHRVLDYVEMFRGTVSQTLVYPREVVKDALSRNSSALLLVHNHPSGSPEPSRADEHLTQTLKSAVALVDVRVLDHLIVAGDSVLSMAERGLM